MKAMARSRRKARAPVRLNLEIAGIALFGAALYLGLAIGEPDHAGALGKPVADALKFAFGNVAWLAPLVVALLGGIVFLEINVPSLIAKFGTASVVLFFALDAANDRGGGRIGAGLAYALRAVVGPIGERIALFIIALAVVIWIGNVSVKRAIGWAIAMAAKLRAAWPGDGRKQAAATTGKPGPQTLRDAFNLPAVVKMRKPEQPQKPRPEPATALVVQTIDPPEEIVEDDDDLRRRGVRRR